MNMQTEKTSDTEPQGLVLQKLVTPSVDRRNSDAEALTDAGDGVAMIEVEIQDAEDKGQAVALIGDDHIRQDRMVGSTGVAVYDSDMYGETLELSMVVVHKEAAVGEDNMKRRSEMKTPFLVNPIWDSPALGV